MIKKLLLSAILSFGINIAHAQYVNNEQFLSDYQEQVSSLVQSYHLGVKEPLHAHIFDIAVPGYYNFLSFSTHYSYDDELMAMRFYPDFKVDGDTTPFCFILYNSNKNLLSGYIKSTHFSYDSVVQYLSGHEMGHCLAAHQRLLNHIPSTSDRNQEEKIADSFAIAYFLYKGQEPDAIEVINIEKRQASSDIHANGAALVQFFNAYKAQNFHPKNVYEIFEDSYKTLSGLSE